MMTGGDNPREEWPLVLDPVRPQAAEGAELAAAACSTMGR
jgi:hypothetical protein